MERAEELEVGQRCGGTSLSCSPAYPGDSMEDGGGGGGVLMVCLSERGVGVMKVVGGCQCG